MPVSFTLCCVYIGSLFIKAITHGFDPHTVYFNPEEQLTFASTIGMENESFGFNLGVNDNGEIEIYQILPGSPAWNSNLINEGDVILDAKKEDGVIQEFTCITAKVHISTCKILALLLLI